MSVPRWIVVDDTDPSIEYTGPWFADTSGSQDSSGNFGPAYESTLHGATLNASLTYKFSGSQVQVLGSNNLRNDSGVLDPTWECFIDNISIGATTPFQFAENNWVFCSQTTLVDGPHTLTVNATVKKSQTFWFDDIQYVPSPSVPLDEQAILIDNLDSAVQNAFDSNWHSLGGTANQTQTTNSAFTFNFTGVSLSWYGFIPTEFPHNATTGTYSVDKSTPVTFPLKGLPASSPTVYNQKFFQTANLTQGTHQIIVLYGGNSQTTPLTLDYLIVQNGTSPTSSAGGSGGSSGNGGNGGGTSSNGDIGGSQQPSSSSSGGKNNAGIIAGGVVGGLVLIALTVFGIILLRRREKRGQSLDEKNISNPLQPDPFVYSPLPVNHAAQDGYNGQNHPSQTRLAPMRGTYGGNHHQMPSVSITDVSQSIEPPSTASGSMSVPSVPSTVPSVPSNVNTAGHEYGDRPILGSVGQTSYTYPTRSEKLQREAEATAAALRSQGRGAGAISPPSSPPSSDVTSPGSRILMHQDSGLRLREAPEEEVQEIPPEYTAG